MFFAAIRSQPSPFVQRFASRKFAVLKFVRAFVKMSVPKSVLMSTQLSVKKYAQRFAPKSAAKFIPRFAKTSSQSFNHVFIPILVKRFSQHLALVAG